MTAHQTLLARAALGIVAGLVSVPLASSERLRELPSRLFDRAVFSAFAISRLGLFCLVYFVLRLQPRGDIPLFYFWQGRQVLERHLLPYRDFVSSYAPLHPYLDAALLRLWNTQLSIILFAVLIEFLVLPLWFHLGRRFLPERNLRIAALLYLASPISLQFVTVDGQDNVVIAALIALSLLLILRSQEFLSGAGLGVSIVAIKFLPLIYVPALFLAIPRRWRWTAGIVAIVAPVYGLFLMLHAPILQPLTSESTVRSASDLPYLIEAILGRSIPDRVLDLLVLVILITLFGVVARVCVNSTANVRMRVIIFAMCALTISLVLFSKKSWSPYLVLSLFPICLLPTTGFHSRIRLWAFAFFSMVAVTEHSFWASMLGEFSSESFHTALLMHQTPAMGFLLLELLLIAGYVWLLYESIRQMVESPRVSQLEPAQWSGPPITQARPICSDANRQIELVRGVGRPMEE
jgi:Glycosyltransferase family 87